MQDCNAVCAVFTFLKGKAITVRSGKWDPVWQWTANFLFLLLLLFSKQRGAASMPVMQGAWQLHPPYVRAGRSISLLHSEEHCVSSYLHDLIVNVCLACLERETAAQETQYGTRLLTAAVETRVSPIYLCKLFMRSVRHL